MRYISKYSWVKYNYSFGSRRRGLFREPWMGGVVLLISVIIALVLANIPATAEIYHKILSTDMSLIVQSKHRGVDVMFPRNMTVETFINDGLMVIFFFGVGLEIKRELKRGGEIASREKALLPAIAALGGMIVPAAIYSIFNYGSSGAIGWGIPTATDIAFAIGIISLLGNRVPLSLKIFLTALAIVDDLGAILVIAFFYGGAIKLNYLAMALVFMLFIYIMNRLGESRGIWYGIPAIAIWTLFYYSGIHATLSGVIVALLIPSKPRYSKQYLIHKSENLGERIHELFKDGYQIDEHGDHSEDKYRDEVREMYSLARGSIDMSHRVERVLSPYITFVIMPIFALANAGVTINLEYLNIFAHHPNEGYIGLGVFMGLVLGKPLGITLFSYLAVKCKVAKMPDGATWPMLIAVACFGGIGFTMSLFVDSLAFGGVSGVFVNQGKIAILLGSFCASVLGVVLVNIFHKRLKHNV